MSRWRSLLYYFNPLTFHPLFKDDLFQRSIRSRQFPINQNLLIVRIVIEVRRSSSISAELDVFWIERSQEYSEIVSLSKREVNESGPETNIIRLLSFPDCVTLRVRTNSQVWH